MISADSPTPSPPSRISVILFLFGTMFFWGAVYIYMPILPPYARMVGGSLQAAGVVMGAYGLSQLLLRFPLGIWVDYLGSRKPFILLGFILDGAASLGLIFSQSTTMLFLSVFTAGMAASMWVAFTVLFANYFPLGQVGRSMGLIFFFTRLAQALTNYAGGAIAERWGWQGPFYAAAVLSLLGLLLAFGIPERRPEKVSSVSFKNFLMVGRNPKLLTVTALGILIQFAVSSTTTAFTPIYAQGIGASKEELGILLFAFMVSTMLASLLSGIYARRLISERTVIFAGYLLVAGSLLPIPLVSRLGTLYALQVINGVGVGLVYPLLFGLAIQPFPMEQQGTAMGFFQSLYAVGMSVGPVISGLVGGRYGLPNVFILSGILCLLAAIFSWKKIWQP
jgi:predicted MFS family arabinose efflux permease